MPGPYSFSTSILPGDSGQVAWANLVGGALNEAAAAPAANVMMLRDASGRSQIATPSAANDVANKGYVDLKAPLASPTFTGTPTAPTQAKTDNSTRLATTAYVQSLYGLYAAINAQTGTAFTPALTDQGDLVTLNNAAAITVTLPTDAAVAFPVGAQISFVGIGAGAPTFVAGSGATIHGALLTSTQWAMVTAVKSAANTWIVDVATVGGGSGTTFPPSYSGGPASAKVIPPNCSGSGTAGYIGAQPAGNRLVWFPIMLGACTITGFSANVSTAGDGASVIVVGLYSDFAGVRPNALLTTLGSVSATTTGMKALTGASYAWPGGMLWVAAVEQGHTSTCAQVTNDTANFPVATSQALNLSFQAIGQDPVSGALPAGTTGENILTTTRPRIYLTIQ